MIDEQTPSSFQKSEDKPCKSAMCVLVSVEKNALENFPSLLLFPFKNVVLLCYLVKLQGQTRIKRFIIDRLFKSVQSFKY